MSYNQGQDGLTGVSGYAGYSGWSPSTTTETTSYYSSGTSGKVFQRTNKLVIVEEKQEGGSSLFESIFRFIKKIFGKSK